MFAHLQIDDPAERRMVRLADVALWILTMPGRVHRVSRPAEPRSILVFRLERVGDLLMARPGLRLLRRQFPEARIDLVVGSWNEPLARLFPEIDRLQTLDLPWIARGACPSSMGVVLSQIGAWRQARYDVGVNLEGDIRSHLLLRASGARWRAGFAQAGGGPLLQAAVPYDTSQHSAWNILELAAAVGGCDRTDADLAVPPLALPHEARSLAARLLPPSSSSGILIAVHPSGGRRIKQWPLELMAAAAGELARRRSATLIVTGGPADRPLADAFRSALPPDVPSVDLTGQLDLIQLAAVYEQVDLFLGCDSGPMHLAAAVGTPVVAIFGPSDPARWGPLANRAAVVRVTLPCSPCNRIRKPPTRCRERVPECLEAVRPDDVIRAAETLLAEREAGGSGAPA